MNEETRETRIYQDKFITDLQDAAKAYSVTEYSGDKDCNQYVELNDAITICKNTVKQIKQHIEDMIEEMNEVSEQDYPNHEAVEHVFMITSAFDELNKRIDEQKE